MFAVAKKIRTVDGGSSGPIPARGKVEANTFDWRERVRTEIAKRPRGEQAKIVAFVQRWYPRFSTGTMSGLLSEEEHGVPGKHSYSRYIPLINRYLWPDEADIDEQLLVVLRRMDPDEQRKLAEFLATQKRQK